MTRALRVFAAILLVGFASCSTKPKEFEFFNGAPLPKPDQVLVYDFEVTPQDVNPAHGVSARTRAAASGKSRTPAEIATGRKVAAALSQKLVETIQGMGIKAARAAYPVLPSGNDLALRGQFLTVHRGDPSDQVEIGLADDGAQIHAEVQIYQNSLRVEQFEDIANPPTSTPPAGGSIAQFENELSQRPGFPEKRAGDGSAPAAAPVSSKPFGDDVEADASRTAAKLAKPLAAFFLRQGWISGTPP